MLVVIVATNNANAQSGMANGGDAVTPKVGTVSYSIGQLDYVAITSAGGTVNAGLQQPFEIFIMSGIEEKTIALTYELSVYPNPTSATVVLKIENNKLNNLAYELSDMMGKLLDKKKTDGAETIINMDDLAVGSYFISVVHNNQIVKTFKILKNQ